MWLHTQEERHPSRAWQFGEEKNISLLPKIEPLSFGYTVCSTVTISTELFRLLMSLLVPMQTLYLQVQLMRLIKRKFLCRVAACGLYAARTVPGKVQAELLGPRATSRHNFLPFLQRQHAPFALEKEPLYLYSYPETCFLLWEAVVSGKSLQLYSNIFYYCYVWTTQFLTICFGHWCRPSIWIPYRYIKLYTKGLCPYILIHLKLISSCVNGLKMTNINGRNICHKTYYRYATGVSVCRQYDRVTMHIRARELPNTIPVSRTSLTSDVIPL